MRYGRVGCVLLSFIICAFCGFSANAYGLKETKAPLDSLVLIKPELRVSETNENSVNINEGFASMDGIAGFLAKNGGNWKVTVDLRRGVPALINGGAIPFIPGAMNDLAWDSYSSGCRSIKCVSKEKMESLARQFLTDNPDLFPVRQEELVMDPEGTTAIGESLYFMRFQWTVNDVPVEGASIYFRINNGNLIQIASSGIAPARPDTVPSITRETAWEILNGYLGKDGVTEKDEIVDRGGLIILPVTTRGMNADIYAGPIGRMTSYDLAYRLGFRRPGVAGTWEALVDAHTGEILRFVDSNRYGKVQGGVYKTDAGPVQTEVTMPLPYADYGTGVYAGMSGSFAGTSGTSTMTGRTGGAGEVGAVDIVDACGSISRISSADGVIDFGSGSGSDCSTPGFGGLGNTHSARTQYYNVAWIKIKAYTYLSSNSWLEGLLVDNVNLSKICNAYWDGTALNFFKSGGGCGNSGELPGVSLHEWGHGMDDNDGSGGESPPVETRADWTAILQTHQSCAGGGFFTTYDLGCGAPPSQGSAFHNCKGYGDCCLDCSGIRDADYARHASKAPWTPINHGSVWNCSSGNYNGPCGWEDHCESGIATQALWDLAVRDIPALCGMDQTSSWQLVDRLWYSSMPQMGSMYYCAAPVSNGCGGSNLYTLFQAVDDTGDGTSNGTPHAAAIFSALDRHNIACGSAADPSNQNQTTCPALTVSTLNGSSASNSAILSWGAVADATRYFVFRNDTSCDSGFTKIAEVAGLTYSDTTVVNGVASYYRIQASTESDACVSSMSNCVEVTPQPCDGMVTLNKDVYRCSSNVSVSVLDSSAQAPVTVETWSTSDSTHKIITLSDAGSGRYSGSFSTVVGAAGSGEVNVTNGDALYVLYTDQDYCGAGIKPVQAECVVDCVLPVISNVQVLNIDQDRAEITFDTDEPATGSATYSVTLPPSGATAPDIALATSHSIKLAGLTECTRYYFYVSAEDEAGNTAADTNGGSYYSFKTLSKTAFTYLRSESPPLYIPDADTVTGASSVISVAEQKAIQDVNVKINISHNWDADLDIYLVSPGNAIIELSTDNGGSGDNYTDTVFDQEASTRITQGTPPFTGRFKPEGNLSALYGTSAQGDWTLKVYDDSAVITGTLNSWSLDFIFPADSCPESAGTVFFNEEVYGCNSDAVDVEVKDVDLLGTGSADVQIWSGLEYKSEVFSLAETPASSGIFKGSFPTTPFSPLPNDGLISTSGGQLYVEYVDADDGAGGTNIPRNDNAEVDCAGPVISGVQVVEVGSTYATINWTTDVPADSVVGYGTGSPPSATAGDEALVNSHSVTLTGLDQCTVYYFYAESTEELGNTSRDDNSGNYFTFETYSGSASTYTYPGASASIPDNGLTILPLDVSANGTIADVNVTVNITHVWDADLDIYLIHPDGTLVELSTDNGGTGDNYTNTTFDDSAATPVTSGTAPFSGTYRPEGSLAALNNKQLNGRWMLRVGDDTVGQTGTVLGYSLQISSIVPCGPALEYSSESFTDICGGVIGSGGDGIIDPGEDVEVRLSLKNFGLSAASNVSAQISTTAPGVTIIDGTASFPDIPSNSIGQTLSPHFLLRIDGSAACGQTIPVSFTASCDGAEAPFTGEFEIRVGNPVTSETVLSKESFNSVTFPPSGWAQLDVSGTAGNWASAPGTVHPGGGGTHSGIGLAYFNSYSSAAGSSTRLFQPAPVNIPATAAAAEFSFWMYHDSGLSTKSDRIQPQISSDGATWFAAGAVINRYNTNVNWVEHKVDLSGYIGQDIYVGLLGISGYGNDCHIDDVEISYSNYSCSAVTCVPCLPPVAPSVQVNDPDLCVQNGINIVFLDETPLTRDDLYVDGNLVASGVSSPAFYDPGDTAKHDYFIRVANLNDACYADSAVVQAQDQDGKPTSPVILSVIDPNPFAAGLVINYAAGAPALRHDLYKDGIMVFEGFSSGETYIAGDPQRHSYRIAAVNGTCVTYSNAVIAVDSSPMPGGRHGKILRDMVDIPW